jgi:large subunit ribosomal protein L40
VSPAVITREKRTQAAKRDPTVRRVVTQLSVFSGHKKLPKKLKLSIEDLLRHNVVHKAWKFYMRDKKLERTERLKAQYSKIQEACEELETVGGYVMAEAFKPEKGKRFSPELRVPTETPPNEPFHVSWKRTDVTKVKKSAPKRQ